MTTLNYWGTTGKNKVRNLELEVYVAVNFLFSVKFCFSFVLNSLAYITIPKNNGKIKIHWNKKLTTTYAFYLRKKISRHVVYDFTA